MSRHLITRIERGPPGAARVRGDSFCQKIIRLLCFFESSIIYSQSLVLYKSNFSSNTKSMNCFTLIFHRIGYRRRSGINTIGMLLNKNEALVLVIQQYVYG